MAELPGSLYNKAYKNTMILSIGYPFIIYFFLAPSSYLAGLLTKAELFGTLGDVRIAGTLLSTLIFGGVIQHRTWSAFEQSLSQEPDPKKAGTLLSKHFIKTAVNFFLIVIWQLCVALLGFGLFFDLEMKEFNFYTSLAIISFGMMMASVVLTSIFTHTEKYFKHCFPDLRDIKPLSFRISIMVAGLLTGTAILFITVNDLTQTARDMGRTLPVPVTVSNMIIALTAISCMVYVVRRLIKETDDLFNGLIEMISRIKEQEREGIFLKKQMEQTVAHFRRLFTSLQDAVENKDYSRRLTPDSEFDDLALSLNDVLKTLEQAEIARANQNWFKSGETELSRIITGKQNMYHLTNQALQFIARYCQAVTGTVFVLDDDTEQFVLAAVHALKRGHAFTDRFKPGEGIAGQAVQQQKTIEINDIPDDYMRVESALIMGRPRCLLIIPMIHEDLVVGVMELGALTPFSRQQADFLESAAKTLAMSVNAILLNQQFSSLAKAMDRRKATRVKE